MYSDGWWNPGDANVVLLEQMKGCLFGSLSAIIYHMIGCWMWGTQCLFGTSVGVSDSSWYPDIRFLHFFLETFSIHISKWPSFFSGLLSMLLWTLFSVQPSSTYCTIFRYFKWFNQFNHVQSTPCLLFLFRLQPLLIIFNHDIHHESIGNLT